MQKLSEETKREMIGKLGKIYKESFELLEGAINRELPGVIEVIDAGPYAIAKAAVAYCEVMSQIEEETKKLDLSRWGIKPVGEVREFKPKLAPVAANTNTP